MGLTWKQKALRPIVNFVVERWFPAGAFFGCEYFTTLADGELAEKWGSSEMACAAFIMSVVRNANATEAIFTAEGVTHQGNPVGDWRLTIEKMPCAK